jgi:hypothetical protein
MSALHATVREFGVGSSFVATDRALAKAMARPFDGDPRILRDYVAAIGDGEECVAHASNAALGPARVELVGNVAVVHPGTGTLTLPAGAQAVAIDVRGLPTMVPDFLDPNLGYLASVLTGFPIDPTLGGPPHDPVRDALDAAVALALATPVPRPFETGRQLFGLPDTDVEEFSVGLWTDYPTPTQLEPFPAGSAADLPLAVLTGKTLSPAAAEMAVTLRLAGRAWLFGEDVETRVAESAWAPLADKGVVLRWLDLSDPVSGNRYPDVVPADALGGNPVELAKGLAGLGAPPALAPGAATRPPIVAHTGLGDQQPNTLGPGEARAGLVTLHGAATGFCIVLGQAGATQAGLDVALEQALGAVDQAAQAGGTIERLFYFEAFRRMAVALNDGHQFNFDDDRPFTGYLQFKIEESYPLGDHYHVAAALMPGGFFAVPIVTAPGQSYRYEQGPFGDPFPPDYYPGVTPTYTGPVVLLVGTDTVSSGENFSMLLSNNGRPMHVVGRPTGGTNGVNNGIELLGHYSAGWTDIDVHNADGSQFMGIGIPVDIPVTLTQQNLANGNDPERNTAVALLGY